MNRSRVEFVERLAFRYEPDLALFQARIAPLSPFEVKRMGLRFETVCALLRIRESEIEVYTNDREAPVRFVIQEAPDQRDQLQWTIFPA
ncbi:hypothetical protein [Leptolyngbya sp. NIES-2104]|uniref:hypothetical protein n=1 Tax=Leptolyngbya sp. NIES-2104 TaxID=1552121 RepID=UPI0012E3DD20|nr:hypothetical protein [Leptolyngbya sp. NIES-2104]